MSINIKLGLERDNTLTLEETIVLLFQALVSSATSQKQKFVINANNIVSNLWVMAKLTDKGMKLTKIPEVIQILDSLLDDLIEQYNGYDCVSLSSLMYSMARLLEAEPENAAHIKDVAIRLLPYVPIVLKNDLGKLSSQSISSMLGSLAKMTDNMLIIETPDFTQAVNLLLPHVIKQVSNFNAQGQANTIWALAKLMEKWCDFNMLDKWCDFNNEPSFKIAVYGILLQAKTNIESTKQEVKINCQNIGNMVWSIAKFIDYKMNFDSEPEFDDIVYTLFNYAETKIKSDTEKQFITQNIVNMMWAIRVLSDKMLDPNIPNPCNILKFKKIVLELLSHSNIHESYTIQGIKNMLWAISSLGDILKLTKVGNFRKIILELLAKTKIKAVSNEKHDQFSEYDIASILSSITHMGNRCLLQHGSQVMKETVVALLPKFKIIRKKESLDYSLPNVQYCISRMLFSLAAMGDLIEINEVKALFDDMVNKISVNVKNYNEQTVFSAIWALIAYNARLHLNYPATDNSIIQRQIRELFNYVKNKTIENNNKTILAMTAIWLEEPCPVTIKYKIKSSEFQDILRDKLRSKLSVTIEEEKILGDLAPVDLFLPDISTVIEVYGPRHYFCHDFFIKNGSTLLKKVLLEKLGYDVIGITVCQVTSNVSVQKCIDQIRKKIDTKSVDDHFALPKVSAKEKPSYASDDDYHTASDNEYHTADEDNDNGNHTTKENEKHSASKENKKSFTTDEHLREDENKNAWQKPKKRNKKKHKTAMPSH